jgi:hypothetical protein
VGIDDPAIKPRRAKNAGASPGGWRSCSVRVVVDKGFSIMIQPTDTPNGRECSMTFKGKLIQQHVSTGTILEGLVDDALRNGERFTLEKTPGHSLAVAEYGEDGLIILKLHRGKKWDGWISSPREAKVVREFLIDYYHEPLSTSGEIEKRGEWFEVGVLPPVVWLVAFGLLFAIVIWSLVV